ncbi:MAG: D-alanyl-D-alanine carboxypeptidase/D-alanyl-D-alanine endopeptidase [Myxococcota bacterium]
MQTHRRVLTLAGLWLLLLSGSGAHATDAASLAEEWLADPALEGVRVGVSIVDLADGREVAAHEADVVMNPASGTKLLTTTAALRVLERDTRWVTRVVGERVGETVDGPLRLVGGGDPKLLPAHLTDLAKQVAEAGVRAVGGGVVVDASLFDDDLLPPAYDQKDADAGYRPAVGAAGSNFGAVRVVVQPGRAVGRPLRVSTKPATDAVEIVNEAKTVAGKRRAMAVRGEALPDGRTRIVVSGRRGARAGRWSGRKRVADPDLLSGYLLAEALRDAGVEVRGDVRVVREPSERPGDVLAKVTSQSLADTIADTNTWSNNYMAEVLFKHLGGGRSCGPAEWDRAVEAVEGALEAYGLDPERFRIVNGSGLYRGTHVAPRAMTRLLLAMARDDDRGPAFRASLAVAGGEGTLRRRLGHARTRGKVRGKTGTLDEVVSLSGYVPTESGRELAFAVFVNEATPDRTAELRAAIDRLVFRLAGL